VPIHPRRNRNKCRGKQGYQGCVGGWVAEWVVDCVFPGLNVGESLSASEPSRFEFELNDTGRHRTRLRPGNGIRAHRTVGCRPAAAMVVCARPLDSHPPPGLTHSAPVACPPSEKCLVCK